MNKITGKPGQATKVKGASVKVSARTIKKIAFEAEYKKALAQMRRQTTIAKNIGATGKGGTPLKEFREPKKPTRATINRLKKHTEYLKSRISVARAKKEYEGFLRKQDESKKPIPQTPQTPQTPQVNNNVDESAKYNAVINNLLSYAKNIMMGSEVIAGIHKNMENKGSIVGDIMKQNNYYDVEDIINEAKDRLGIETLAQNISKNYQAIRTIVADIILALYKKETAIWGGGKTGYNLLLDAFEALLYKEV